MPGSKGFNHHPTTDINQLRDNLRDRYQRGFPIIKELVQNADDAQATRLDLGWSKGLQASSHPLLTGSALFVINDGPFTSNDAESIHQLGSSNRAAEQTAIGKFGLGLKSVFHLCEAFFYLASVPSGQIWNSRYSQCDILNPWAGTDGDENHPDWNINFPQEDQERIGKHLAPLLQGDTWFALWLPLRRQTHGTAISEGKFPGDCDDLPPDILPQDTAMQLATALPLLRCVRAVNGWRFDGTEDQPTKVFSVSLAAEADRRQYPGGDHQPATWDLGGEIQVDVLNAQGAMERRRCRYAGFERVVDDQVFQDLRRRGDWPSYLIYEQLTGKSTSVPEKASPHCAVYFSDAAPAGGLSVSEAVFMPVGEPQLSAQRDPGKGISLVLHAYAFIDAGRSRITRVQSQDTVQTLWNEALERYGIYPLLLPALDRFVAQIELSDRRTRALTSHLRQMSQFANHRNVICGQHQWVRSLNQQGTAWEWTLIAADTPVLAIPSPPDSDPDRWRQVLPALSTLSAQRVITQAYWPRLCHNDPPSSWPPDAARTLLEGIQIREVARPPHLDYLLECLESILPDVPLDQGMGKLLVRLAADILIEIPADEWSRHAALLRRLIALIPAHMRIAMEPDRRVRESTADSKTPFPHMMRHLLRLDLDALLVPGDMEPSTVSTGVLELNDAEKILDSLTEPPPAEWQAAPWWTPTAWRTVSTSIAVSTFKAIPLNQWDAARMRFRNKHIFSGKNCRSNTFETFSIAELDTYYDQRALFVYDNPPRPNGFSSQLQAALADQPILLIPSSVATSLFIPSPGVCDGEACLRTLGRRHGLTGIVERRDLLEKLRDLVTISLNGDDHRSLRYLVHGRKDYYSDNAPLWVEDPGAGSWGQLAEVALQAHSEAWRVLPPDLVDMLTQGQRTALQILTINKDAINQILLLCGPETIDGTLLDEATRLTALRELDVEILARMSIHEDLQGQLRGAGHGTYLEDDFPLDDPIFDGLAILRRNKDRQVAARQHRYADPLHAERALGIALAKTAPSDHWRVIMKALASLPPTSMSNAARVTKWLPTRIGAVAPEDLIVLPHLDDEVHRIVPECQGAYCDVLSLAEEVRGHPGFAAVICPPLIPEPAQALEMLGMIMGEVEKYRIGAINLASTGISEWLEAFVDASLLLPAQPILARVKRQAYGSDGGVEVLLDALKQDVSPYRLRDILGLLTKKHVQVPPDERSALKRLFILYLARIQLLTYPLPMLQSIELLSAAGNWKSPSMLCMPDEADNLEPDDMLDREMADLLRPLIARIEFDRLVEAPSPTNAGGGPVASDESAVRLQAYFDPWRGHVADELIGGVLCLFGGDPQIEDLAESYLNSRHVRETRKLFSWEVTNYAVLGLHKVGSGEDIHAAMRMQRIHVKVEHNFGGQVTVPNVIGTWFSARKRTNIEQLLIRTHDPGDAVASRGSLFRQRTLCLQIINPASYQPSHLVRFLCETARVILRKVYEQPCHNLDEVWEKLGESPQLSVEVAADTILDAVNMYLRQLHLGHQEKLGRLLLQWDQAVTRRAEEKQGIPIESGEVNGSAENVLGRVRLQVRQLLEGDPVTQAVVLGAVRRLLESHYQYSSQSIPFELFQNADDAALEMELLLEEGETPPSQSSRMIIAWDNTRIQVQHWGRPINTFRRGSRDWRDRGFERDLTKMLSMSSSDKSIAQEGIRQTGKFGLGFKSVFFVTDQPLVLSGRLGFAAVAGMLPRRLTSEELTRLERDRERLGADAAAATLFHLPLAPGRDAPSLVMGRFLTLAHIQVAFSQRITTCELRPPGQEAITVSWSPQAVPGVPGAQVGDLYPAIGDRSRMRVLVVGAVDGQGGKVLLALDARGFVALPDTVPTIWVTAPTQEYGNIGIAINHPEFDLDVGRAQLARQASGNAARARELGIRVGKALCDLYNTAVKDWNSLRTYLALAPDVTREDFWHSFWRVLAVPLVDRFPRQEQSEVGRLVAVIMKESRRSGVAAVLATRTIIPTLLPAPYHLPTSLDAIKLLTDDCLARTEVFRRVAAWPTFKATHQPGTVVSSKVWQVLESLIPGAKKPQSLTLIEVITGELDRKLRASPDTAARLGQVVTRDFVSGLDREATTREECQALRKALQEVRFQARDGSYYTGDRLVLGMDDRTDSKDEQRRAKFAPDSRVLAEAYDPEGRQFFKACRELNASAEELARWGLDAKSEDKRRAFLDYLLNGELGRSAATSTRSLMRGTWLETLDGSPLLGEFTAYQRAQLLASLYLTPLAPTLLAPQVYPSLVNSPPVSIDPRRVLADIYDWWSGHHHKYVGEYNHAIYPAGSAPRISREFDPADTAQRREWMILLILGACHTMGRVMPGQHRGFIELCSERGWLDVFAAATPREAPNPTAWIRVLEEFMEKGADHIEYFHYMRQFVSIYALARWLTEYERAFLSIDQLKPPFTLDGLLRSRTFSQFQGGGPDAPPIAQALGLGASFVVRELVRSGVLRQPHAYAHCYVPVGRVRWLFAEGFHQTITRGLDGSSSIHRFLSQNMPANQVTFHDCFDLPFLILADDLELRRRFFGSQGTIEPDDPFDDDDEEMPT